MPDHSKSRPAQGPARAPSLSSSENASSNVSDTPVAVESSILSETLSNIDFDDFLGLESDSSSGSESTPMVPWNVRARTRNEGGNTLVTQSYTLTNNTPHLNHFEWRSGRKGLGKRRPEEGRRVKGKSKRGPNKPSRTAGIPISRDFFLLVALCIGLACALICLARPAISSMILESTMFSV